MRASKSMFEEEQGREERKRKREREREREKQRKRKIQADRQMDGQYKRPDKQTNTTIRNIILRKKKKRYMERERT